MTMKPVLLTLMLSLTLALLATASLTLIAQAGSPDHQPGPATGSDMSPTPAEATSPLANLPLRFIPNHGQTDPSVKFHLHSLGGSLFFSPREVVFALPALQSERGSGGAEEQGREKSASTPFFNRKSEIPKGHGVVNPKSKIQNPKSVLRLTFDGANPQPVIEGLAPLPGGANFFLGNDPAQWQSNLPTYEGIVYRNLYPSIDLAYRGTDGQLKSEFIVAPGADPGQIRLRYAGAEYLSLRDDGALVIHTPAGELVEAPLLIYQEIKGVRRKIEGHYLFLDQASSKIQNLKSKIANPVVSFQIAAYDPALPLIIDPELVYSSYLGGSGDWQEFGYSIGVDDSGNIYITGGTNSANFPTKQAIQTTCAGCTTITDTDVFITQLINADGVYTYGFSTFLGGNSPDCGLGIAVDKVGNIYVAGSTSSINFPTRNAVQSIYGGPYLDAFVTQLITTSGAYTLGYSTYLGGNGPDYAEKIAIDNAGNSYIVGATDSANFPTRNELQGNQNGRDSYVTKIISANGVYTYGYSTYLGGNGFTDEAYDIAVDGEGNSYIVGRTDSTDFPTWNEIQSDQGGGDIFVTKIISAGGVYTYGYSTYLGGTFYDSGYGIAVDNFGSAYVFGETDSNDFPTWKAIQGDQAGRDVVVTKIISAGGVYTYGYSTYLGGSSGDRGYGGIAVDSAGNVYVAGSTNSTDFPIWNEIQTYQGFSEFFSEVFVTQIISSGGVYTYGYSTYLGGSDSDFSKDLALDSKGNVYITGGTESTNFPTLHPLQSDQTGTDAFVTKISPSNFSFITVNKTASLNPAQMGDTITYTYRVTNSGNITLTNLTASDDKLGQVTLGPATLAPSQSASGTLTYTVVTADLPGPLTNTVVVSGTPPEGVVVTAAAAVSVTLLPPDGGSDESLYLPVIVKND